MFSDLFVLMFVSCGLTFKPSFGVILQTKLRIGLAEQTLLAALGQAAVYTEEHSTPPPHIQSPLEEVI
jgi:hypothetical protein